MKAIHGAVLLTALAFGAGTTAGEKTPEAAFSAMHDAYHKKGVKEYLSHVTPESQKTLAGGMVTSFFGFRKYVNSLKDKNPDAVALLDGITKRHALDEVKIKTFMDDDKGNKTADALIAKLYALAELVKDPQAFVADVVTTLNRIEGPFPPLALIPFGATVKDVKISGNTARGTMHYRFERVDRTETVYFQRDAVGWKIDFLPGIRAAFEKK